MDKDETQADKDYLPELYKAYEYSSTEFDKSLTFISSGLLAVSFAFIEKIVPLEKAIVKSYLISGWYILLTAIFVSVLAHFISILAIKYAIKNYKVEDDQCQEKIRFWGDLVAQLMNLITLILILIGGICIINFIKINI